MWIQRDLDVIPVSGVGDGSCDRPVAIETDQGQVEDWRRAKKDVSAEPELAERLAERPVTHQLIGQRQRHDEYGWRFVYIFVYRLGWQPGIETDEDRIIEIWARSVIKTVSRKSGCRDQRMDNRIPSVISKKDRFMKRRWGQKVSQVNEWTLRHDRLHTWNLII